MRKEGGEGAAVATACLKTRARNEKHAFTQHLCGYVAHAPSAGGPNPSEHNPPAFDTSGPVIGLATGLLCKKSLNC
eukprot:1567266-Pyramimonas_sp.AAC.1